MSKTDPAPKHSEDNTETTWSFFTINKTFLFDPPAELKVDQSMLSHPPQDWKTQLTKMDTTEKLATSLEKHIGPDSTYTHKQALIEALLIVFYRLIGQFDDQLGKLSKIKQCALFEKLTENIADCSAGFQNRVNEIIQSFTKPKNFSQLLHLTREHLVLQLATILTSDVHATNRMFVVANEQQYGVRGRNSDDPHRGNLSNERITAYLAKQFDVYFTPFQLPYFICDALRSVIEIYDGPREGEQAYTVSEVKLIIETIQDCLYIPSPCNQMSYPTADCYFTQESDDNSCFIQKINWSLIRETIRNILLHEQYLHSANAPVPNTVIDLIAYHDPNAISNTVIQTAIQHFQQKYNTDWQLKAISKFDEPNQIMCERIFTNPEFIKTICTIDFESWPELLIQGISIQNIHKAIQCQLFPSKQADFANTDFANTNSGSDFDDKGNSDDDKKVTPPYLLPAFDSNDPFMLFTSLLNHYVITRKGKALCSDDVYFRALLVLSKKITDSNQMREFLFAQPACDQQHQNANALTILNTLMNHSSASFSCGLEDFLKILNNVVKTTQDPLWINAWIMTQNNVGVSVFSKLFSDLCHVSGRFGSPQSVEEPIALLITVIGTLIRQASREALLSNVTIESLWCAIHAFCNIVRFKTDNHRGADFNHYTTMTINKLSTTLHLFLTKVGWENVITLLVQPQIFDQLQNALIHCGDHDTTNVVPTVHISVLDLMIHIVQNCKDESENKKVLFECLSRTPYSGRDTMLKKLLTMLNHHQSLSATSISKIMKLFVSLIDLGWSLSEVDLKTLQAVATSCEGLSTQERTEINSALQTVVAKNQQAAQPPVTSGYQGRLFNNHAATAATDPTNAATKTP